MKTLCALAVLVAIGSGAMLSAYAAPKPFYLWQSLATGRYMCAQNNPGSGWMQFSGPYNNAGCR